MTNTRNKPKTLAPRRSRKPLPKSAVAVDPVLKSLQDAYEKHQRAEAEKRNMVPHATHLFNREGLWEGSQCTFRGCPVRLNGAGLVKLYP